MLIGVSNIQHDIECLVDGWTDGGMDGGKDGLICGWIDWTNDYTLELRLKASCKSGTSYIADHTLQTQSSPYNTTDSKVTTPHWPSALPAQGSVSIASRPLFTTNIPTVMIYHIIVCALSLPACQIKRSNTRYIISTSHKIMPNPSVDHPIANKLHAWIRWICFDLYMYNSQSCVAYCMQ